MSAFSPARIGLTGGIGSGKSTVAAMFSELGVPVLNLDDVGHDVLDQDIAVQQKVIALFGEEICGENGKIDRARLAAVVFSEQALISALNAIVHPVIWQREQAWLAEQDKAPYAVIEAPVLIEAGAADRMDSVVVVTAEETMRRQRIASRGGYASRFDEIAARQCADEERRNAADYLITNGGNLEELRQQVKALHKILMTRFGS